MFMSSLTLVKSLSIELSLSEMIIFPWSLNVIYPESNNLSWLGQRSNPLSKSSFSWGFASFQGFMWLAINRSLFETQHKQHFLYLRNNPFRNTFWLTLNFATDNLSFPSSFFHLNQNLCHGRLKEHFPEMIALLLQQQYLL